MALTEEGIIEVPGLLSRWVRLPNGCKAHYVTSGESGPAVFLMHGGLPGSSGTAGWQFMAPYLGANGFRVYCPDFPGFGLTEAYRDVYAPNMAGQVEFAHDFANAMCLDQFHVSGNSTGCLNAVNYITSHPERIISYVLIAGFIGDIVPIPEMVAADQRPEDERFVHTAFDGKPETMHKMMAGIVRDPSKISDELVTMRTQAANQHHDYWVQWMQSQVGGTDENVLRRLSTKGRFDEMTIPGIYLYGTEDVMWPHDATGYLQEDRLPNVQFFYPADTGHQGQTDQPELHNEVFLEFFRDGKVSWDLAQRAGVSTRRPPLGDLVAVPDSTNA